MDTVRHLVVNLCIKLNFFYLLSIEAPCDNLEIDQIAAVIKTAKIGRGFNFLPRETPELERKLEICGAIYHEEPTPQLKQRILAILHELKCRHAISSKDYNTILCDLDL